MTDKRNKNIKVSLHDVLTYFINNEKLSIPQIAKEMDLSLPTVSKVFAELMEKNYIICIGKQETIEGRPPMLYTINPQLGYFIGVDIKHNYLNILLNIAKNQEYTSYLYIIKHIFQRIIN